MHQKDFRCIWVMYFYPHEKLSEVEVTLANKSFHNIFHKAYWVTWTKSNTTSVPSAERYSIQISCFWWHRGTGKKQFCCCRQTGLWQDVSPFLHLFHLLPLPCLIRRWRCSPARAVLEQQSWLRALGAHSTAIPSFCLGCLTRHCLYCKHTKTHHILWY